ncbi:D-alanyl-D-alanine carboxypeptidase family protein [Defluviitalea raffinosedens]|jgi:D-alanyl-D-alanine carboxypeptidase|uniref:serine-type D-Ala-D-Ala carboxypeptidase n=1 Tax=Defluviitalea raffinosedens TaxID=1450156 RepID=A0A7C8HKA2_9FIRM|nr:D-alanyl-D-alanine carboxypeptidase family protein [Defluviitalea raffinosedens]KAE9637288.1 D-alanyl-D-alanine carboxypeptidase [Defluviitalea raffinosedens]MBM7685592.1 D-alanyl-D-alanine carboxypeptidase [Defluviitalea raffinosedens]MBZ4668619.1 dacF 2 [Defluviitaleaceae bacterium]HHW66679.1 D-alanyl-D-alanine carboxypeptidase [Candidatus Epulonipiscium sp.]
MYSTRFLGRKISVLLILILVVSSVNFIPSKIFAQNEPIIQSDSAILIDAKTGAVLYEKNIHKRQFPASITKIMTALLAVENGNLDDIITFSYEAVHSIEYGSSHIGMREGEQITLRDALHGMLLMSANEVSNAIAEYIDGSIEKFAEHMTDRAKEIGAYHTNFVNPHGLHNENHYTTAYDMALIAREALKYDTFREIIGTATYIIPPTNLVDEPRYLSHQHRLFNQKAYANSYYEGCIGGKTGFTNEASHTLVTYAERNGIELIVVTLKSEKQAMYDDTRNLLDYGFDHFEMVTILNKKSPVVSVPVVSIINDKKEYQGSIEVYAEEDFTCLIPKGIQKDNIIKRVSIPSELQTPIHKNQLAGTLDLIFQNKIIGQVNLITGDSIEMLQPVSSSNVDKTTYNFENQNKYLRIVIMIVSTIVILLVLFGILIIMINSSKRKKRRRYMSRSKLKFTKDIQKR